MANEMPKIKKRSHWQNVGYIQRYRSKQSSGEQYQEATVTQVVEFNWQEKKIRDHPSSFVLIYPLFTRQGSMLWEMESSSSLYTHTKDVGYHFKEY